MPEGVHPCLVKVQQFQQGGAIVRGVELQPIELLGRRVDGLPPLSVDITWPGILKELAALIPGLGNALLGSVNDDAHGYFDVEYLDDELLIRQQGIRQAPRGVLALVKVDSCDP